MVSTKDYLSLSALAYVDFESVDKGKTIGSLPEFVLYISYLVVPSVAICPYKPN